MNDGDKPVGRVPPRGDVGRVPPHGEDVGGVPPDGAADDTNPTPQRPVRAPGLHDPVGRVPPHGAASRATKHETAGSGDPTYSKPPRRLRRLHRVWPDRNGNISYLLTMCIDGRARILDNQIIFERFVAFLLDSPTRYRWFGRRFVIMPDHIHVIAHMGHDSVRLGQWIKALKAVVGGLRPADECPVRAPGLQPDTAGGTPVGRVPSRGVADDTNPAPERPVGAPGLHDDVDRVPPHGSPPNSDTHEFTRIKRSWRWQDGYHDHKFRTPESESRKWE